MYNGEEAFISPSCRHWQADADKRPIASTSANAGEIERLILCEAAIRRQIRDRFERGTFGGDAVIEKRGRAVAQLIAALDDVYAQLDQLGRLARPRLQRTA